MNLYRITVHQVQLPRLQFETSVMFTESQDRGIVDGPSAMESPIYNIPEDLLFTIFSVNASHQWSMDGTYGFKPITTTRFSSQVCKQWRHLILGSPSLWGGLLNLNDLILGSDDWINEVLSRTKKAMLTVQVRLHSESLRATPLLFKILDEEWPRIQHLEVDANFDDNRWLSIQRPTENLRSISLRFPVQRTAPKPPRSTTTIVLFSGHAPSLRSVSIRHMDFQLPALWLSQLSELRLAGRFSPDIVMKSLSAMPFLEMLEISYSQDAGNPHLQWPKIILPRLKCLITRGPLGASLMLLDHIIPPPGCGLDFGSHISVADQDLDLPTALRVLSRYCDGYFKIYNPCRIQLLLDPTKFGFHTPRDSEFDIPPFDVRIENENGFSSMSMFFNPFLDCPLSGVSSILFIADDGLAFLPSDPNFSKFISLLSSVRSMQTTPKSLHYLSQISTESGVAFFPSLWSVDPVPIHPESVAHVTDFLLWLKSVGSSIQHLGIGSQSNLEDRKVCLSPLEQFSGLRVHWVSSPYQNQKPEYICGTGTPERLDFVGSFPTRFFDERRSYSP
jgi:hypothetical protein